MNSLLPSSLSDSIIITPLTFLDKQAMSINSGGIKGRLDRIIDSLYEFIIVNAQNETEKLFEVVLLQGNIYPLIINAELEAHFLNFNAFPAKLQSKTITNENALKTILVSIFNTSVTKAKFEKLGFKQQTILI